MESWPPPLLGEAGAIEGVGKEEERGVGSREYWASGSREERKILLGLLD